jgi:hypothetical protein
MDLEMVRMRRGGGTRFGERSREMGQRQESEGEEERRRGGRGRGRNGGVVASNCFREREVAFYIVLEIRFGCICIVGLIFECEP